MEQNPYETLEQRDSPRSSRPGSVTVAVWLLLCSVGLFCATILASWLRLMPGMGKMSAGTTSDFVGMAFFCLMAFKIAGRRNWARWLFAIVVLVSVGGLLLMFATMPQFGQIIGRFPAIALGLNATQSILQIAALALVFTRESSVWFKGPSNRTDGSIIRDAG